MTDEERTARDCIRIALEVEREWAASGAHPHVQGGLCAARQIRSRIEQRFGIGQQVTPERPSAKGRGR